MLRFRVVTAMELIARPPRMAGAAGRALVERQGRTGIASRSFWRHPGVRHRRARKRTSARSSSGNSGHDDRGDASLLDDLGTLAVMMATLRNRNFHMLSGFLEARRELGVPRKDTSQPSSSVVDPSVLSALANIYDLPTQKDGSGKTEEDPNTVVFEFSASDASLGIGIFLNALLSFAVSTLVVRGAEYAGLDVEPWLASPSNAFSFLGNALVWTVPLAAASRLFWPVILRSETIAGAVFREEAFDKSTTLEIVSAFEIVVIAGIRECSKGLIFRGVGLAAVTLALAGLPIEESMQTEPPFFPHLPALWLWPFISIGVAAVDALAAQATYGGFSEMSQKWMAEAFCSALEEHMPYTEKQKLALTRQLSLMFAEEDELFADSLVDQYSSLPSGQWPTQDPEGFLEHMARDLRLFGPSQLYNPLKVFLRSTLFSAETIFTGNIWCSVITASVLTAIEEISLKEFNKAAESGEIQEKLEIDWVASCCEHYCKLNANRLTS